MLSSIIESAAKIAAPMTDPNMHRIQSRSIKSADKSMTYKEQKKWCPSQRTY